MADGRRAARHRRLVAVARRAAPLPFDPRAQSRSIALLLAGMGARKILAILAIRTPRPSLSGVFEALARIEEALSARQRAELLSRAARVRDPVPLTSELERVPGRADRARARTSLRFTFPWCASDRRRPRSAQELRPRRSRSKRFLQRVIAKRCETVAAAAVDLGFRLIVF
jgi:hypothetical protein